jgi:hypothetical protein
VNISDQSQPILKDAKTIRAWIHAASGDYVTPVDWQNWADQLIAKLEMPPIWILELSASKSALDLISKLQQILDENAIPLERGDHSILGFLVLAYERENLSLRALISRAAETADGGNASGDREVFTQLLSRLESGEDKKTIETQFKAMTSAFRSKALSEWGEIKRWSAVGR